MRIIVANYRFFIAGGPEKYMFKFIEAAEKSGVEVIPFSVKNSMNVSTPYEAYFAKPRSKQLLYADTKKTVSNYFGILRATLWNYDAEKRLRRLIRDTRPDAVYILHEINHLSPSIIRAAKKEHVRVIHRISDFFMFCARYDFLCDGDICEACLHGDYSKAREKKCVKGSKAGTALRLLAMKIYSKTKIFDEVDAFITTCEFTKNKMIEGGMNCGKITCIPTFIDSSKIKPCYEHDNYFLFLGRLAKQKGAIYAIKAMSYLKDTGYTLKITGELSDSEEDQVIWKYIVDNGLEKKIEFTGFKHGEDLQRLISRCTCVLCPAIWYENMPNTVIEAYAAGKPVVASRVGSFIEIVDDGVTGRLFEMKNDMALADILSEFISDCDLSVRLGRNAREKCERDYDVDTHMKKVLRLMETQ